MSTIAQMARGSEMSLPPPAKLSDKGADDDRTEKEENPAITTVLTTEVRRDTSSDSEEESRPLVRRHSRTQLTIIVASLYFSVFLAALDSTITTTALPTITQHFNSSAGYTWIGSAYLLGMAASTPSWGKVSDIWGRRPIMLCSVAVFLLGSLLCGVAASMAMLIIGRAVQGVGAGGILTLVNICQGDLFSMKTRVLVFASESLIWAAAAALGPLLGGAFSELVSWRWCFYINLPAGGLAFVLLMFFLTLDTPSTPLLAGLRAVDWIGSLTIVGATISILLGLEFGGVIFAWDSARVLCLIIFGFVMVGLFLYNEAKLARYPIMPLHLFREKSNVAALGVGFFHSLTYLSASYYMPLYTQAVRGYTPLESGISLLPFAIALPISAAATGVTIQKTGRYVELIWIGLSVMTLGFGLFISLTAQSTDAQIVTFQILAGAGSGIAYSSPLIALQTLISPDDNATATATYGFLRYLATAVSVVLGGVIFQNEMESHAPLLREVLGPDVASLFSGREAAANVLMIKTLDTESQKELAKWAFATSLRSMWIFYTCTGAAGLLVSFWVRKRVLSAVFQEVRTGLENEELKRKGGRRGVQS